VITIDGLVHVFVKHTANKPARHAHDGQNGMMSALWEMGCEEDSDYHQVVGDGVSGQGCGLICQN